MKNGTLEKERLFVPYFTGEVGGEGFAPGAQLSPTELSEKTFYIPAPDGLIPRPENIRIYL